jgi:arylformamidase
VTPGSLPRRVYDLSQPVFAGCPQYVDPNPRPAQVRRMYMASVHGVNKEILELSTHTGTHCDAPFHFFDGAATIDETPLQAYIGWATILDLRGLDPGGVDGRGGGCRAVERGDLERAGDVRPGAVALLNTGWGRKRANTREYLTQYPFLAESGAAYLLERQVKGVGIDTVSLGGYGDPVTGAAPHRVLLGAGKFIVEDLSFPDEVMDGVPRLFCAVPVLLRGCGAAWTRAMLWEL